MTGRSPKDRLKKLFHRHEPHDDAADTSDAPSPASPTSPSSRASQQHLRKASSGTQMYSKGLSESKRHSRRISADINNSNNHHNAPSGGAQAGAQVAAAKAMYPERDMDLPTLPRQTDLSSEMGNLTLSNNDATAAAGKRPYSEDVADRNLESFGSRASRETNATRASFEQRFRPHRKSVGNAQPLMPERDRHSEDVAARNLSQGDQPQPLAVRKRAPAAYTQAEVNPAAQRDFANQQSLSRKQDVKDLRRSQEVPSSSLNKALPIPPSSNRDVEGAPAAKHDSGVESELGKEKGYLVKDSEKPVALSGILDLRNTEDTTLHERWAPAVTHEVIQQNVHEIREEVITREIHEYHNFHRILPIIDIEVLPARHFTPVEGGYVEIAEEEVPGRAGPNAQWVIAETVSRMMPKNSGQLPLRHFTARKFEGSDGDYKEYTTADGIKRTETWWVHPPTIETGGMETGQTYPFYFGSPNPAENGLRASLPAGNLIGVSPLLAQKQRERQGQQQSSTNAAESEAAPPPVPQHKVFPADLVDSVRAEPSTNYSRGSLNQQR